MLFLDVKAAFPSVETDHLFHNMKTQGVPREYTDWYKLRLKDRTTSLAFDDFESDTFHIQTGLDQGCPISLFAFLFYNAPLIELAGNDKDQLGLSFIDNTAFITQEESFEKANEKLRDLMEKEGGALEWSRTHHAEFKLNKTALICASRICKPDPQHRGKTTPTPCYSTTGPLSISLIT